MKEQMKHMVRDYNNNYEQDIAGIKASQVKGRQATTESDADIQKHLKDTKIENERLRKLREDQIKRHVSSGDAHHKNYRR